MVKGLRFRAGVHDRLLWTDEKEPLSFICSSCGRSIDEREAPLRLMGRRCAVFCEPCVELCFETVESWPMPATRRRR